MESALRKHNNEDEAYAHNPNPAKRICSSEIQGIARETSGSESDLALVIEELQFGHQRIDPLWKETVVPLFDELPPLSTASIPPHGQETICYGAVGTT
jgi:hypothetical protein